MKFSVLIAHYNNARYFKDCYDSLLKQTYPNWEAVILDDASKPEEKQAVQDLIAGDSRFRYFENEKNSGVGTTKAKLIELATGEICGFVDPDDAVLPNAIQNAVSEFKRNPKTVLSYSRFMTCNSVLKPISEFKSAKQVPNNNKYFFNYPVQIAHFVCFRRATYMNLPDKMNPELKIAEDQDLYLKLYDKGLVKFIDETNYLYRTHDGGISQNDNKKKSHEYWGEAIFNAMKRRGLKEINGKKVPETFTNSEEIFQLLEYQNKIPFRLKKKIKVFLQKFPFLEGVAAKLTG